MFAEKVRLKAENDEPKCKNCARWTPREFNGFGECERVDPKNVSRTHYIVTTDLALCSAWEMRAKASG